VSWLPALLPARRRLAGGVLAACAAMALGGCSGGAIGQNTAQSSGKSFVSGSFGTTYNAPGSRPAAPQITGTTLTGQKFSLAAERGNLVVLNFWGSWCSPCRTEAPALAALARQFASQPVRFFGVDVRDSPSSAEAFMRTFRVSYPSLNDPGDEIALIFHGTLPPTGIPSTLVIDRTGHIAARIVGGVTYSGLKSLIMKVNAGAS
jgi:thiol-disulfide isomerase/thioredoxin